MGGVDFGGTGRLEWIPEPLARCGGRGRRQLGRGWGWATSGILVKPLNGFGFHPSQLRFRANYKDLSESVKEFSEWTWNFPAVVVWGYLAYYFCPKYCLTTNPRAKRKMNQGTRLCLLLFLLAFLNVCGGVVHFNTDVGFFFPLSRKQE